MSLLGDPPSEDPDQMDEKRLRTLTMKGQEAFQENTEKLRKELEQEWNSIQTVVMKFDECKSDINAIQLLERTFTSSVERFNKKYEIFHRYLVRENTEDSLKEVKDLESYLDRCQPIMRNMKESFSNCLLEHLETLSSSHACSSTTKRRFKAELSETKLKFKQQEAELLKQKAYLKEQLEKTAAETEYKKAVLDISLDLIKTEKENAEAQVEARVHEEDELDRRSIIDKKELTKNYIKNLNMTDINDHCSVTSEQQNNQNSTKFWPVLERNFTQGLPTEGTEERRYFEEVVNEVHNVARDLLASRKGRMDRKFIDVVMENGHDETTILGDILVYLVGGFHSTSITLTWCIYHSSKYPASRKQLQEELSCVLEHSDVTPAALKEMRYLRSFINETLRLRFVAPVAIRKAGQDTVIGGYRIPNDVDIIQAISVVLTSKELWSDPYRFDPDRFTAQRNTDIRRDSKEKRSPLAFCPFGFAGRRKCPGQKFFFEEAMVFLSVLFNNFEFTLLDDRDVTIMYGLLTRPEEDIFATLKVRQGK